MISVLFAVWAIGLALIALAAGTIIIRARWDWLINDYPYDEDEYGEAQAAAYHHTYNDDKRGAA
jgi:hypothetical protein